MYGTIARIKVKPGAIDELKSWAEAADNEAPPGYIAQYIYQMDADPDELYVAVIFESKEAYFANAQSPEQNGQYEKMLEWLEAEPEWHNGEIVLGRQNS